MASVVSVRSMKWVLVLGGLSRTLAFPSSEDPITAGPKLGRGALKCTKVLFDGVELTNYNEIATAAYTPPDEDCFEGSVAVLEVEGGINAGRQYDRYGALWLGGVELLRTTTPEPNAARGITWRVAKDVSEYAMWLRTAGLNASLSIPNTVDSTYTGVLTVSANLSFYEAEDVYGATAVLAASDPLKTPNPWNAMGVSGTEARRGAVTLPFQDAYRVVVDLYASGHSCDEFWYTNVPGNAPGPGLCGQGAYREFRVFVDGILARVGAATRGLPRSTSGVSTRAHMSRPQQSPEGRP